MQAFERERERTNIWDSDPTPSEYQSDTLTTETLDPQRSKKRLHVATGKRPQPIPAPFLSSLLTLSIIHRWRFPADGIMGLGGLTVQAQCLSRYSHHPTPQGAAASKGASHTAASS